MLSLLSTLSTLSIAGALALGVTGPRPSGSETATGYETELARQSDRIALWTDRAVEKGDWVTLETLAGAHQERARLTGDWDDYAAADSLLGVAFSRAPEGSGPHLTRARLHFSLHRFDRVEDDLRAAESRILLDDRTRAAIRGLRADVALQRGRPEEARRGLEESLRQRRSPTALARLATYHAATGDPERADALLAEAARLLPANSGFAAAWFALRRGLLDLEAGRLDDALAHYRDADARLGGWWLVEEHVAEIGALRGETARAVLLYEDLVRRTGNPEFMDALARLHRDAGRGDQAAAWIARADRVHRDHLARFPEAACGHALDHYLELGNDPDFAVELAERDFSLRPNETARARLATAHRNAARKDDAASRVPSAGPR